MVTNGKEIFKRSFLLDLGLSMWENQCNNKYLLIIPKIIWKFIFD